jgi:ATP-dependent exoDNAse (exonuclease V) alpha subunit
MGTIEKVCHDGNITLRLEDARTIEFSATVHPHFDHGYAVTSHSAQGLTADRVLINADTKAHPDLLSSRFAYVSVSRARIDAEIFTNNAADLGLRLCNSVEKSAAVDFSQSKAMSLTELGMGQAI